MSSISRGSNPEPPPDPASPLYTIQLLSALRNGDSYELQRFLAVVASHDPKSPTFNEHETDRDLAAELLHLSVKCASVNTIQTLLTHRSVHPNAIFGPLKQTPLHVAVSLSRSRPDVVRLLVNLDDIDDTIRDVDGKTPRDLAIEALRTRGRAGGEGKDSVRDCLRLLDESRHAFSGRFQELLHSYILTPSTSASDIQSPTTPTPGNPVISSRTELLRLLRDPRVSHLDLDYLDEDTGQSLLHAASQKKDLEILEAGVKAGASVLVRNRLGQLPIDLASSSPSHPQHGKDKKEREGSDGGVRGFLKERTVQQTGGTIHRTSLTTPVTGSASNADVGDVPGLKGYLNKYTNVARGYNVRWFVLKGGVLSYYKGPLEESVSSRGSISMRSAVLKRGGSNSSSSSDSLRFEVMSYGGGSGNSKHPTQKWYLKASHANEAERWFKELERSIEWSRRLAGAAGGSSLSLPMSRAQGSSNVTPSGSVSSFGGRAHKQNGSVSSRAGVGGDGTDKESLSGVEMEGSGSGGRKRSTSTMGGLRYSDTIKSLRRVGGHTASLSSHSQIVSGIDDSTYFSIPSLEEDGGAEVGMHFHSGYASMSEWGDDESDLDDDDLESNAELGEGTIRRRPTTRLGGRVGEKVKKDEEELDLLGNSILSSIASLKDVGEGTKEVFEMVEDFVRLSGDARSKLKMKLEREKGRGKAWEEAVRSVVQESSQLEQELVNRTRHRPHHHHRKNRSASYFGEETVKAPNRDKEKERVSIKDVVEVITDSSVVASATEAVEVKTGEAGAEEAVEDEEDGMDTDEEDEFFDAIDNNNLPGLVVPESLEGAVSPTTPKPDNVQALLHRESTDTVDTVTPSASQEPSASLSSADPLTREPYKPYTHLRTKLELQKGNMPNTSLWSVLKNSIGKDLTKISFPVHFNEPTSMLQRMAEDMEFSNCLDVAARSPDPLIRTAYVAAFGMSNYSSTIGRIAKPFNPMLSETFEYVRPDKEYRYISEQVSHHPPISACWAESPRWHYYGEVDAQNKFMGKSFEIRPTGVAHAELLIPESFVSPKLLSQYPRANSTLFWEDQGKTDAKVSEHYSWKKVTTNVSGFIFGSPTIDHYGDMVVTNHRTGDQCILTFKPRGWRAKDAYEISGVVKDSSGNIIYEIAGRWNSQLIARKVGSTGGSLDPDEVIPGGGPTSPTTPGGQKEYILLWRNSPKIEGSPFNLTPFALTLNDCPPDLKPYICPTDCRIRPDQRAFEIGQYDRANGLKLRQEEKQRTTRRAREEGKAEKHRPRWFSATTDGDTGERVWAPVRLGGKEDAGLEYWGERERTFTEISREGTGEWKDVEKIFIEEPGL